MPDFFKILKILIIHTDGLLRRLGSSIPRTSSHDSIALTQEVASGVKLNLKIAVSEFSWGILAAL